MIWQNCTFAPDTDRRTPWKHFLFSNTIPLPYEFKYPSSLFGLYPQLNRPNSPNLPYYGKMDIWNNYLIRKAENENYLFSLINEWLEITEFGTQHYRFPFILTDPDTYPLILTDPLPLMILKPHHLRKFLKKNCMICIIQLKQLVFL